MIGILLFAALMVAEVVCYFKDDDAFDGIMLFGRPIVAFLGALLCDGSFGGALLWAVCWGIGGLLISILLAESRDARDDYSVSEDVRGPLKEEKKEMQKKDEKKVEKKVEKKDEKKDEKKGEKKGEKKELPRPSIPLQPKKPEPPKQPAAPVYRDDIFEISGTELIRCKEYHDYIRIPQGVTVIKKKVFRAHTHLRRVIFPDTLKTIEEGSFFGCTLLEKLVLPEGVETIGKSAFYHCRSLQRIHLPKSMKKIDSGAFAVCTELSHVSFAVGCMVDVESDVFKDCRKLREFIIPGTVNVIGTEYITFFKECDKKTIVRCHAGSSAHFEAMRENLTCVFLDGKRHDATDDFLIEDGVLKKYTGNNPEVIIPEGTKSIKGNVFKSAKRIVRVVMPDSVTTIGAHAFASCKELRSVRLSSSLKRIPNGLFHGCEKLTDIILPQGITAIGEYAFASTKLAEVQLPNGLKSIKYGAFSFCSKLGTLYIPSSVNLIEDFLYDSKHVVIVAEPGSKAAQYAEGKGLPLRAPGSNPPPLRAPRSEDLPGNIRRTYYETLEPENKLAYSALVQPLLRMESRCDFTGIPLNKVVWNSVEKALEADYPEIFWVNWRALWNDKLDRCYTITKDQRDQAQQQIDALVKPFLASIPRHWGDYEKAKRAYEWVADKLEYDHAGLEEQKNKQYDSVTCDDLRNIYGAFVKKKVVCVGYAQAYVYLLHAMGIECVMRTSLDHAWACAKLEGDYYHIDVTWGDSRILGYAYFGLTDDEIYILQIGKISLTEHIACNATRCSYYAKEGLYPECVDTEDLLRRIRKYVSEYHRTQFQMKFSNGLMLNQAEDCLKKGRRLDALAKELGYAMSYTLKDCRHNLLEIRFR